MLLLRVEIVCFGQFLSKTFRPGVCYCVVSRGGSLHHAGFISFTKVFIWSILTKHTDQRKVFAKPISGSCLFHHTTTTIKISVDSDANVVCVFIEKSNYRNTKLRYCYVSDDATFVQ